LNYLQLCQRMVRESGGLSGSGPSAVTGQVGEYANVVDWIASAWLDIQREYRSAWRWMHQSFTLTISSGDAVYTASDAGLTDLRVWDVHSIKMYQSGVADEFFLDYLPYDQFRATYLVGTQSTGRPQHFTVQPDNSLRFGWVPDGTYYVSGQYWQTPVTLAANTDTPGMPSHFHDMIWQLALMKYAVSDAVGEIYAGMQTSYNMLHGELVNDQLPDMTQAEPLV